MSIYQISKTSFLKLEQCHKAFFLYKNHPYLKDKITRDKQLLFRRGHNVGFYARNLFPGGVDVTQKTKDLNVAVQITADLIQQKTPAIYEATFCFKGVLVMVDILVFSENKYNAYEVKSSLKVSETYLKDAYLQYYVLKHVLEDLDDLFLITLNPDYRLEGKPEPKKLFRKRSVKSKAEQNFSYFEHRIDEAVGLIERNVIPDIPTGKQCFKPYQCDFYGTCWKTALSESNIFSLPMISKFEMLDWHNSGIRNIKDIPDNLLKPRQIKVRDAFSSDTPLIDYERIEQFIQGIQLPFATLDIEAWGPAIPEIQGTHPFEQIPFLVSVNNGKQSFSHFEGYQTDERREFCRQLILLSENYNSIVVFGKSTEDAIINYLAVLYPEFENKLSLLKHKIIDVSEIFNNLSYFDPLFKSNLNLKSISEVLLKNVCYTDISSGLEAMNIFEDYRKCVNPVEQELLKTRLIDYCETDCEAVFSLLMFLKELGIKKPSTDS